MDRKGQLRNVAFGGAWSEQIAGTEALAEAMRRVEAAPARTVDEDLREDRGLVESMDLLAAAHPKGDLLGRAWRKALDRPAAAERARELRRIAVALRSGLGARLGP